MAIKASTENIKEGTYRGIETAASIADQRISFTNLSTVKTSIPLKPWAEFYSNYSFNQEVLYVHTTCLTLTLP